MCPINRADKECIIKSDNKVKINEVNRSTLDMYGAASKEELDKVVSSREEYNECVKKKELVKQQFESKSVLLSEKKEKCEKISDCQFGNVNVDDDFKFSTCTPQYPPGFDRNREQDAELVCGQATQTCTAVKVKELFGGWEWVANEDCTKSEFTEKMNDYCKSLGDCGGYVNILGEYDQGFYIGGDMKAPNRLRTNTINTYKGYAMPNPNQPPAQPGNFSGSAIGTSLTPDGEVEGLGDFETGIYAGIGSLIGGIGAHHGFFGSLGLTMWKNTPLFGPKLVEGVSLVPKDALTAYFGLGFISIAVMMLLGVPIYVCATASVPIAAGFIHMGASPGAAGSEPTLTSLKNR